MFMKSMFSLGSAELSETKITDSLKYVFFFSVLGSVQD